ncbi:MAG: PilZ domain-containing protein [Armatimonadota bacterium]|nr:PilZ domain-containing protein [Armatimonadota bacterium]
MPEDFDEIEEALLRQDEAMALLERLRLAEPLTKAKSDPAGGGRRDFRRWPTPAGVTLELHDGEKWQQADVADLGIGGARLSRLPDWLNGPVPARLRSDQGEAVLVLADTMWRDETGAGLRFEFGDNEERDQWTATLIDALLARYALA